MRCFWQIEKGNCRWRLLRWAFDRASQRCVPFIFSGCNGNANRYPTLQRCQRTCMRDMETIYPRTTHPRHHFIFP
ncbi:Kunitz/Bovine pancreatic trypsin inhibitor domain protein [Ancylostoma duodenale]|nr:Kunitz/Bovine pancreatic trypsin inhibitor domain protein [Ancylostoma duodenale]